KELGGTSRRKAASPPPRGRGIMPVVERPVAPAGHRPRGLLAMRRPARRAAVPTAPPRPDPGLSLPRLAAHVFMVLSVAALLGLLMLTWSGNANTPSPNNG